MSDLVHQLITDQADQRPNHSAIRYRGERLSYEALADSVGEVAGALAGLRLGRGERVAIYLDKRFETIAGLLGAAMAGGVFVPVNPLLRAHQVGHILRDCQVRILITTPERARDLATEIGTCTELRHLVLVGSVPDDLQVNGPDLMSWDDAISATPGAAHRVIDTDMAAILYTSGSTGRPKGVILTHRNLVAGAKSVSQYLENTDGDRILSVLPLSFDAGLSQLTTGLTVGAEVVLVNYLMPRDVVQLCAEAGITGLTCVPPLWMQLAQQDWPPEATRAIRYFANTGGHMPRPLLDRLRTIFPNARPYLMYGLTEAFRSTYLDPSEIDRRPNSIGKAIPNAEILVVRPDGSSCSPGEQGELVHRGALVAKGYWNDPGLTKERFRPAPGQTEGQPLPEIAVWSGDTVYADEEGFLYFVGRRDEMIKSSGYRISPTEIEEILYAIDVVGEAAVFGVPHPTLGEAIVAVVVPAGGTPLDCDELLQVCREQLPRYMVPAVISVRNGLPRSPNGKIDRGPLKEEFKDNFPADNG